MSFAPLRFESYATASSHPNVVVDGSPNESTVLTLTHWPGYPAPDGLAADLSAQMAFRYLDAGRSRHGDAEIVTNNHFDQDGVVSVYALHEPEDALRRRDLLEDLAAGGDFATYRDRRAARLSMVLAAYADPERSPVAPLPDDADERGSTLYQEVLERLPALIDEVDHPGPRRIWEDEDRQLTESEEAIAAGDVTIEEHAELDLGVVTVPVEAASWSGHRFAHQRYDGIHPMAVHNATDQGALLLVRGRRYELTYRYESWVQMRTRRPRARVDLRPLADRLSEAETDATWHADPPGALTPQLHTTAGPESRLPPADVLQRIGDYLRSAPPAWDPYAPS